MPVLAPAWDYVRAGIGRGDAREPSVLADFVSYDVDLSKEEKLVLCDAQTSGGLLAAVARIKLRRCWPRCMPLACRQLP